MKVLRVYNAKTMNPESNNKNNKDGIVCSSVILAIEFIPDRNSVAVSLSDRTIAFYDFGGSARKFDRKLHVPSTQKCLTYVERRKTLFSAGVDGAIFAWDLSKLFSNEFNEAQIAKREKEQKESGLKGGLKT